MNDNWFWALLSALAAGVCIAIIYCAWTWSMKTEDHRQELRIKYVNTCKFTPAQAEQLINAPN